MLDAGYWVLVRGYEVCGGGRVLDDVDLKGLRC